MTIKSDRWIRKMALEQGMIEPFVDEQMRRGVISYGLTSYGYDVRVASEFKVFSNVFNVIVDPKNFNDRSFVDIEGDYCDIPPNSFALARSVERFRIPRNVLCLVIGKSSYARCFSGGTRVALVDGTNPSLEEMARRAEEGESFWGYSIGQNGRVAVTLLDAPRYIGRDKLVEITLDNGEVINATPDHQFIMRDGRMRAAETLRSGESLMPLYRELARGYEMVYQPLNGFFYPTHRLADEWNLRNGIYADIPNTHRHHRDHNRQNNAPWNIERMDASEHLRYHNQRTYGEDFDPAEHSASIRAAFERLSQDTVWRERLAEAQSIRAQRFWHDELYAEQRNALLAQRQEGWSPERHRQQREAMQRYYADPANRALRSEISKRAWSQAGIGRHLQQAEIARGLKLRPEITAEVVRTALDQTGSIRAAARLLNCDRTVFRRFPEVIHAFKGTTLKNHKVAAVKPLAGEHDVFCLTVPEAGNFALDAGVFVSNCGLIVNITPLEPEWEGYVTIEISNTTPLPARIYANEGIGQILFLESDEPPEVSYRDKAGKYQGQVGIVLPKVEGE